MRAAGDALTINRKRWLAGARKAAGGRTTDDGRQTTDRTVDDGQKEDRAGKADRLLVGIGETIDEALEVERELKRMRRKDEFETEIR